MEKIKKIMFFSPLIALATILFYGKNWTMAAVAVIFCAGSVIEMVEKSRKKTVLNGRQLFERFGIQIIISASFVLFSFNFATPASTIAVHAFAFDTDAKILMLERNIPQLDPAFASGYFPKTGEYPDYLRQSKYFKEKNLHGFFHELCLAEFIFYLYGLHSNDHYLTRLHYFRVGSTKMGTAKYLQGDLEGRNLKGVTLVDPLGTGFNLDKVIQMANRDLVKMRNVKFPSGTTLRVTRESEHVSYVNLENRFQTVRFRLGTHGFYCLGSIVLFPTTIEILTKPNFVTNTQGSFAAARNSAWAKQLVGRIDSLDDTNGYLLKASQCGDKDFEKLINSKVAWSIPKF